MTFEGNENKVVLQTVQYVIHICVKSMKGDDGCASPAVPGIPSSHPKEHCLVVRRKVGADLLGIEVKNRQ